MSIVELAAWIIVVNYGIKLSLIIAKGVYTGWKRAMENHR